ncbi:unnamed protein product [Paramecium octaurelia]|uniref:Uncharacterized protein n=1 Tax=Paramecium octaurelia TaxID=43137 RepID=A0A8S1YNF4_PAROT|nr:unnamed protein product [Paramecium octaurelia]
MPHSKSKTLKIVHIKKWENLQKITIKRLLSHHASKETWFYQKEKIQCKSKKRSKIQQMLALTQTLTARGKLMVDEKRSTRRITRSNEVALRDIIPINCTISLINTKLVFKITFLTDIIVYYKLLQRCETSVQEYYFLQDVDNKSESQIKIEQAEKLFEHLLGRIIFSNELHHYLMNSSKSLTIPTK